MASASSFNSVDSVSLSLPNESGSPSYKSGLGLCRNAESHSVQAPIMFESHIMSSNRPAHPFFLRSRNCMVTSSFAIAATTAIGLSILSLNNFAVAAELDSDSTTIVSVANMHGNASESVSKIQSDTNNPNPNPASFPSMSSNPISDISLSMAIPIPHEQQWLIVRKGYTAPLPRVQRHESSSLKCPQWTPSELELFLPDFNGRPKPFPRQGRHWFASFAVRETNNEAFLQVADLRSNPENEVETDEEVPLPMKTKLEKEETESRLALLEMLGMEKHSCFSM